ncbi:hypothetical protein ABK040_002326 [Willaertia magna]
MHRQTTFPVHHHQAVNNNALSNRGINSNNENVSFINNNRNLGLNNYSSTNHQNFDTNNNYIPQQNNTNPFHYLPENQSYHHQTYNNQQPITKMSHNNDPFYSNNKNFIDDNPLTRHPYYQYLPSKSISSSPLPYPYNNNSNNNIPFNSSPSANISSNNTAYRTTSLPNTTSQINTTHSYLNNVNNNYNSSPSYLYHGNSSSILPPINSNSGNISSSTLDGDMHIQQNNNFSSHNYYNTNNNSNNNNSLITNNIGSNNLPINRMNSQQPTNYYNNINNSPLQGIGLHNITTPSSTTTVVNNDINNTTTVKQQHRSLTVGTTTSSPKGSKAKQPPQQQIIKSFKVEDNEENTSCISPSNSGNENVTPTTINNTNNSNNNSSINPRKTKKSTRACEACRKHHRKCDGQTPCQTCHSKGIKCVYTERKKRGPKNEANKKLKLELEQLREELQKVEDSKNKWKRKCLEIAKFAKIEIDTSSDSEENVAMLMTINNKDIAVTEEDKEEEIDVEEIVTENAKHLIGDNSQKPVIIDNNLKYNNIDNNSIVSGEIENVAVSIDEVTDTTDMMDLDMDSKKRKRIDSITSDKEKLLKKDENVQSNNDSPSSIRSDGRRFALCSMITRFVNFWDKFIHPYHSLLPNEWESIMPDLLTDMIRNDPNNSENNFFMYSLLCNCARSAGDLSLSKEFYHKSLQLLPVNEDKLDSRVGSAFILLGYYKMTSADIAEGTRLSKKAFQISSHFNHQYLNLKMNALLAIASLSDSYDDRKTYYTQMGDTNQICDIIMSVSGFVENEITLGRNTDYKDLIERMAAILKLKNLSTAHVTLMHEVFVYSVLILCLHKAGYKELALNYGRKLLELAREPNFKHICVGTISTAIANAASMFLDFEGYPEFFDCTNILDELSVRFDLPGLVKKGVEARFCNQNENAMFSSNDVSNYSISESDRSTSPIIAIPMDEGINSSLVETTTINNHLDQNNSQNAENICKQYGFVLDFQK